MKMMHSAVLVAAAATGFAALPSTAEAGERDSWSGCSVGLQTSYVSTTITFPNAQPDQDLSGVMAGPAAACRMEFNNNFVIGVGARGAFGELEAAEADGNEIRQFATSDSLVALTLEVGYAFNDDAYVYFEAGQGWMTLEQREQCMDPATIPFGFCRPANGYAPYNLSEEQTEEGVVLGAGIRLFISDDWTLGARYSRYEMEGQRYANMGPAANGLNLPAKQVEDHDVDEYSIELAYEF